MLSPPLKTCIRGWTLSLVALALAGCSGPAIDVDIDSAKETFKQRQLSNAKDKKSGTDKAGATAPNAQVPRPQQPLTEGEQRQLIQFRYGEKSLQDPVFVDYLRNHADRFSRSQRPVQQGVNKTVGWTAEERKARRRLILLDEMRGMNKELGVSRTSNQTDKERESGRRLLVLTQMREMRELLKGYGTPVRTATDQLPESEINYRGAPVLTVYSSLASQAAVPIRYSDGLRKSRLRVSGTFVGDPVEIMSQISRLNRLALRTESAGGMFHLFLDIELEANPKLAEGLHDPFSSAALSNAEYQVINQYRYIVGLLETGDDTQFRHQIDALNPPQVGLSATQAYEKFTQAANKLKNTLREYDAGDHASGTGPQLPFRSATLRDAEFHVVNQYRKIVSSLENGDDLLFFREVASLMPPQAGPSATAAFELITKSSIRLQRVLRRFDAGEVGDEDHPALASLAGKPVLASAPSKDVTDSVLALGKYEAKICPGEEEATEKVKVTSELPANVKKFLDSYFSPSIAAVNTVANPQGQSRPGGPGAATGTTGSAGAPQAGVPAAAGSPQPNQPASPTANAPGQVLNAAGQQANATLIANPNSAANQGGQTTQPGVTGAADCASSVAKRQPLKILEDPTGILLTGSVYDLDLAFRLVRERDIPTLQVLAEVFIVEVTSDWERKISGDIRAEGERSSTTSLSPISQIFGVIASAAQNKLSTTKTFGTAGEIAAFIELLEKRGAGRNISSPTIIARDGEAAELNKILTLRKEVPVVLTTEAPGGSTRDRETTEIKDLVLPLKLSIKPQVNRHNKHTVLTFEYDETLAQGDQTVNPIAIPTVQNKIKTNVETAPGDVVILAGLFKETNSRANAAPPGLSGLGILTPLLGGSHSRTRRSSELIVFIKPTVIEPRAFTDQVNTVR